MYNRYGAEDLIQTTGRLFQAAGLAAEIGRSVAEILVEADLLGYSTHGLQFVPAYLGAIEAGKTKLAGRPEIIRDSGNVLVLDADGLPGQWAVLSGLTMALERIETHPMMSVAIRRSGNISCLATYARRAAEAGYLAIVTASAPGNSVVAPHGGRKALLSTNPIAFAIPSEGHPILADTSTSSITNRAIERAIRQDEPLPADRVVDGAGRPSTDAGAVFADPPGAILPLGGMALGHKGFAFSLLVEALTSGLAGAGRSEGEGVGNNTFLLLLDPEAFSGVDYLRAEMAHMATAARNTEPVEGGAAVRLPGDGAYAKYEEQTRNGVYLNADILGLLVPCFEKYGMPMPAPIGGQ